MGTVQRCLRLALCGFDVLADLRPVQHPTRRMVSTLRSSNRLQVACALLAVCLSGKFSGITHTLIPCLAYGTQRHALPLTLAAGALVVQAQDYQTADTVAALAAFPYCRCDEYRCGAAPYKLVPTTNQMLANGRVQVCFKLTFVGCQINSACCQLIVNDVGKVEFSSGARAAMELQQHHPMVPVASHGHSMG